MTCNRSSTSLAAWLRGTVRTRFLPLMCKHSLHKRHEQGTGLERLRREFGVELNADEERMIDKLDALDQILFRVHSCDAHAMLLERRTVVVVELVAMTVTFRQCRGSVCLFDLRAWHDRVLVDTQAHRATQLLYAFLRGHQVDNEILRVGSELLRVCVRNAQHVPRKLDAGNLHAQTDTQEGQSVSTRVPSGQDHAFDAAFPEATRDQNAVILARVQQAHPLLLDVFAVDQVDVQVTPGRPCAMVERFAEGQIGIIPVSYTHLRAHETVLDLVCR